MNFGNIRVDPGPRTRGLGERPISVQSARFMENFGPHWIMIPKDRFSAASVRGALALLAAVAALATAPLAARAQSPALGGGSAQAGQPKVVVCAACHGMDGNSVMPEWPSLAGQHARYTVNQLHAYKDGERLDAGMRGFAATLSEQDIQDIGAFFASQSMAPKGADPEQVALGEQIYRGGIPERSIAACIACHGPTGRGNPLAGFPRVSHQHAQYLATTLQAYRAGERRSDADWNQMMRDIAESLLDEEIRALASYMQGLQ
jgi:cytochrome c553